MTSETMIGNLDLNMKKRVPKKPKMRPPYNKTQEQERKAKHKRNVGLAGHLFK
jgi:hypothetical protein